MAAPAFDEAIPLFWLQDGHAPYKGIWMFQQTLQGRVEATHCTFSHEHGPACVIENWSFEVRAGACDYAEQTWQLERVSIHEGIEISSR